jgi:hypothetical protein
MNTLRQLHSTDASTKPPPRGPEFSYSPNFSSSGGLCGHAKSVKLEKRA